MNVLLHKELASVRHRLEKRLNEVKRQLTYDPLAEYIRLGKEFEDWLEKTQGQDRYTPQALDYIEDLGKKRKKAQSDWEKLDPVKLIDEQIELESALNEFHNLFYREFPRESK